MHPSAHPNVDAYRKAVNEKADVYVTMPHLTPNLSKTVRLIRTGSRRVAEVAKILLCQPFRCFIVLKKHTASERETEDKKTLIPTLLYTIIVVQCITTHLRLLVYIRILHGLLFFPVLATF